MRVVSDESPHDKHQIPVGAGIGTAMGPRLMEQNRPPPQQLKAVLWLSQMAASQLRQTPKCWSQIFAAAAGSMGKIHLPCLQWLQKRKQRRSLRGLHSWMSQPINLFRMW